MRIRILFGVCLILLALNSCANTRSSGNPTVTPIPSLEPTATSTPLNIEQLKIPEIRIETDYPSQMIINQSYLITVSLVPETGRAPISRITVEKATAVATSPTPVGTPGSTLKTAFGDGFVPYATAILNAGSFDVKETGLDEQSLDQSRVEWEWNVTPRSLGTQVISINMVIQWETFQSGVFSPPKYSIGNPQLQVKVNEPPAKPTPVPTPSPFITLGTINISDLFSQLCLTLLGAGGLVAAILPALLRRIKKKADNTPAAPENLNEGDKANKKTPTVDLVDLVDLKEDNKAN